MKTLTITDAKKNLGRWLAAAGRGEDIGIVCGADIIALHQVTVESMTTRSASAGDARASLERPRTGAPEACALENWLPSRRTAEEDDWLRL
jgi:antitoxin (DNA-binding transcriptional repressor) of toxin-antitoxin stability system